MILLTDIFYFFQVKGLIWEMPTLLMSSFAGKREGFKNSTEGSTYILEYLMNKGSNNHNILSSSGLLEEMLQYWLSHAVDRSNNRGARYKPVWVNNEQAFPVNNPSFFGLHGSHANNVFHWNNGFIPTSKKEKRIVMYILPNP